MNAATLAAKWLRVRSALLADYPELASDEQALQDTIEGETQAIEAIAALIRSAQEDKAMAKALKEMNEERQIRKERIEARADRREQAAYMLMSAIELRRLVQPDFTLSVRSTPWGVRVDYPEAVPDSFCRIKREPDKAAIKAEYAAGRDVPGVTKTNGGEVLAVRIR